MNIQNLCRINSSILISLFLVSCAAKMYSGPPVSNDQLALITGAGIPLYKGIQIRDYDGEGDYYIGYRAKVLAGLVSITVEYYDITKGPTYSVIRTISFTADPGHIYTVIGNEDSGSLKVWVEDAGSGKVIQIKQE